MRSDFLLSHAALSLTYLEKSIEVMISGANDINELAMEVSEFNPIVVSFYESRPMAKRSADASANLPSEDQDRCCKYT